MPPPSRPPPYALDERSLDDETRVEVFTAGGPGGQHRNKTQNGVRLHHAPSGLVISATERRSLEANRRAAFERLVARLERLNEVRRPRTKTRPTRSSQRKRLDEKTLAAKKKRERSRPRHDD
jgi:protein subunit release factor A